MTQASELDAYGVDELLEELRARGSKERSREAQPEAGPGEGLRAAKTPDIVRVLKDKQRVIYGVDDRRDLFQLTDQQVLTRARGVVSMFTAADISDNGDGTSTLSTSNFGTEYGLCSSEPFRNQPIGPGCSGFLVRRNIIATAGHCVTEGNVTSRRFVFGFRMRDAATAETVVPNDEIYKGVRLIGREEISGGPDWALVEIDRLAPQDRVLAIRETPDKIADDQNLYVLGHPCGLPIKFAGGANVRDNQPPAFFIANLDTYGGNSGSPVFNSNTHVVEGILVRGETDFVQNGNCNVSLVCPSSGCRGEDCTRVSEFISLLP